MAWSDAARAASALARKGHAQMHAKPVKWDTHNTDRRYLKKIARKTGVSVNDLKQSASNFHRSKWW